ncbi:septum site-determining protein Ssd [Microlunatus capsulatus]|uniref:Secretion/DNA translocation related CpaE-like protein n=1 Tax=Microlunatus capsulatus TaxID=99117 RepID=A0ABS4Z967_9ACTN|nr:septum site-determining protein Ssd [Microlunatus capsulatus]MBP2417594.1 secretion/DNA translocation related CpaE-like protein [Microlunatus capsulatus]
MDLPGATPPVVVTADPELLARVHAVTATLAVQPRLLDQPAEVRDVWASAPLVVVGPDLAAALASLRLPPRRGLLVVGHDEAPAAAVRHSAGLGAAVLTLPSGAEALADAVSGLAGRSPGSGRLLALTGASGGVGTSTAAAALALVAARDGTRAALVDLDERGGGLDLLLGAEQHEGWRWPRLSGARGFLGDLHGQLPVVEGVDVLATARLPDSGAPLTGEAVGAVLLSLLRSHALVVVDLPREATAGAAEVLRRAEEVLLVVRADVRGVAAGREAARLLVPSCAAVRVLTRHARRSGLAGAAAAEALGLGSAGVLPHDPAALAAGERGEPPARSDRSVLARTARAVLAQCLPAEVRA